MEYIELVNWNE